MSKTRKVLLFLLTILILIVLLVPAWMPLHPTTRAAYNIAEYRVRRWWWDQVGAPRAVGEGSLSGWVQDTAGRPVADALVLVSTAVGETFTARTNEDGWYAIPNIPSGRYRPIAAAWDYDLPAHSRDANAGPMLSLGQAPQRFDPTLTRRTPPPLSPRPETLVLGPPVAVTTDFPTDAIATRRAITFTHENAMIDGDLLYTPAEGDDPDDAWPLLVIVYPSPAIRWEKATIQFAAAGYAVLAITPDEERGLDLEAHARDLRLAVRYAQEGLLSPAIAGPDFVMLTGSFGSLFGYRALPDLQHLQAIVNIGGVSDGFLGVQALYSETLAIPPPYDLAVASMGRPDRDPGFFLAYSPAFFAAHHPPTLLIHTYEDEVIPYNQSQRLADALSEAGVPHELHLYHAKTHYLDPRTPSDEAYVVFELVFDFIKRWFPAAATVGA